MVVGEVVDRVRIEVYFEDITDRLIDGLDMKCEGKTDL